MDTSSKFRNIAGFYRDKILAGAKGFEPGDQMPSRRDMAAMHGTTRNTIDDAMQLLVVETLINLNGNQRATVADRVSNVPSMDDRMASLRATGKILSKGETCEVLQATTVECPASIAAYLGVDAGEEVLLRSRVVKRNGRPLSYSDSYFPRFAYEAAPELAERANIEGGARELAVYNLNSAQEDAEETFTARMATDREKTALELTDKFAVVLQALRVVFLSDGRVVEVAVKVGEGATPVRTRRSLRPTER